MFILASFNHSFFYLFFKPPTRKNHNLGTNTLVGRDRARILRLVDEILATGGKRGRAPEFWDGRAAERIATHLATWLATRSAPAHA